MQTLRNNINDCFALKIQQVQGSTGSLHTKDDVIKLLQDAMFLVNDEINRYEPEVVNTGITLDNIRDIVDNLNVEDFCKADYDSAEFNLSYRNQIELDSVEIELDHSALYDAFVEGVEELTEQSHPITETQVA